MFNKTTISLFGSLILSALSIACGNDHDIEPEVAQQQQAGCSIALQNSTGSGLKTTATIANNGSASCAYTVQFAIVVDELETFGVYWKGNLTPGQSVTHQQIFEFDPAVFDVGNECSQYSVLVTDPSGTRMTTADCS